MNAATADALDSNREYVASRLLASSEKLSFDPNVEIDWDAPFDEDKFFLPERRCTLYGTEMWERMSRRERIELSKHELANVLRVGIWGELILMQMLLRHAFDERYDSAHFRYALTEIGDECRHSAMFGRMIEKLALPSVDLGKVAMHVGRLIKSVSNDATAFIAAIWLEEATDAAQREAMDDETVQPLVRAMFRIHVIEEARHIRYGRNESARQWAALSARKRDVLARSMTRLAIAVSAGVYLAQYVRPAVYAGAGLPRLRASWTALTNPNSRGTLALMTTKVVAYSSKLGLLGFAESRIFRAIGERLARSA